MNGNDIFNMFGDDNDPFGALSAPQQQNAPVQEPVMTQATRVPKTKPQEQPKPPVQGQVAQANNQANSTVENLRLLVNKDDYTDAEWEQREKIYIEECNKINVNSANLTPSEITVAAGKIEALLTPLRIDNILFQRKAYIYDSQLKVEEKRLYNVVKLDQNGNPLKLTVDETKGLIVQAIQKNLLNGTENLYQLDWKYNGRAIFTKGMIDALMDKKDLLITYSGILKIESTVSGFQPNVPTGNQVNRMGQ